MLRFVTCLAVVLSVLAMAMPASADFITGVTATAGSPGSVTDVTGPQTTVNGLGMYDDPVVKTSLMDNNTFGAGMWGSAQNPAPADMWLKYEFAAPTSLNEMVIWNHNSNADSYYYSDGWATLDCWHRGLKDVTITYSTADNSGEGHLLYQGILNMATGADHSGYTNDLFVPGGPVAGVQAVKIAYTSNWSAGDNPLTTNNVGYYGLSEVRFAATPEPGTVVLLTSGLIGLLAYAWRKRK